MADFLILLANRSYSSCAHIFISSALPGSMKAIVKGLMNEGKSVEKIGKQLEMKPEEISWLSDFSKEDFLKMMVKGVCNYSKAEYITKI